MRDKLKDKMTEVSDYIFQHPELSKHEEQSSRALADFLEQEGFTVTIHGKGTYVAAANKEMMMEEYRREVEEELTEVIRKAKRYGLPEEDIREMLELILEG